MDLMRRPLHLLAVLLLAVALGASAGVPAVPARAVAAMAAVGQVQSGASALRTREPRAPDLADRAKGHAGHAAPHGPGAEAREATDVPADHGGHEPAHCSLCLVVQAFVDLSHPASPSRRPVARPILWIGPAVLVPIATHARAPPARGPPVLVVRP